MKFDFWVESLIPNLFESFAIEYQGQQHYYDMPYLRGIPNSFQLLSTGDNNKINLCQRLGISLVCVPFYSDWKTKSVFIELIKDRIPSIRHYLEGLQQINQ